MTKNKNNGQTQIAWFAKKQAAIALGTVALLSLAWGIHRQSKLGSKTPAVVQASPPCAETNNDIPSGGQISSTQTAAIASYRTALDGYGMDIVVNKVESGYKDGHLTVHVKDRFLEERPALRHSLALLIAEVWANTYGANDGITCVQLLDSQSDRIGGQNAWGEVEVDGFDEKAHITLVDSEGNNIGRYNARGELETIGD